MVDRSPKYPNTDLEDAISQITKVFSSDRRNPIDRIVAAKHMGYSGLNGSADKTLGALMQYGLLEKVAKGEVSVSKIAVDILHPEAKNDRLTALTVAANNPRIFAAIRERFPDGHFSSESLKSFLIREGFSDGAIPLITKIYDKNRQYLKLEGASEGGGPQIQKGAESKLPAETSDIAEEKERFGGAKLGDYIMWESGGSLQFSAPQRVRSVSDDGEWVFVDGSTTGIPMSQVTVEHANPVLNPHMIKAPELPLPLPMLEMSAGEYEWMRNKLGPDITVRILTKGDLGPREIGRLIKLLEAQKLVLEDDVL